MTKKQTERVRLRNERLDLWAQQKNINLERLDEGQRWVAFAALRACDAVGKIRPLRRAFTYFLSKADMGLTESVIGAITGVSDRSVRVTKAFEPKELVSSIAQIERGHRQPKLKAEHAGLVAQILVENPKAKVPQILQLLKEKLDVTIQRDTFSRYIERYGLGVLRQQNIENRPLFLDTPTMAVLSS